MTANELVWTLISFIQIGIVSFVAYWTRRVTKLEDIIYSMGRETEGRMVRLETQYTEIVRSLTRIEATLERREE